MPTERIAVLPLTPAAKWRDRHLRPAARRMRGAAIVATAVGLIWLLLPAGSSSRMVAAAVLLWLAASLISDAVVVARARARRPRRVDVYPDRLELRDWTQLATRAGGRILIPHPAVAGIESADRPPPDRDDIVRNSRILLAAPYQAHWRYGPGPAVLSWWHNRQETKLPVPREISVDFDAPGQARSLLVEWLRT